MKRVIVWFLIVVFVCLLIAFLLKACETGLNSEHLETPETTQEETVPEETVKQDLPATGGVRLP